MARSRSGGVRDVGGTRRSDSPPGSRSLWNGSGGGGAGRSCRSGVGWGSAAPAPSVGRSGRQQCRAMGGTGTCRSSPEDGHTTPEQHACTTAAGVDRGVTVAVACSDGTMRDRQFSTPGEARRYLVLQKKLARQKKGSTNRKKTVAALRQVKRRERDRRQDFVSWTANRLATRHRMVAVEDLKTRNMTRSAKGTVEEPGSRVAQKAGLNRSILGKGWHKLQLALENVARCTGTTIVKVPAAYTSQRCSACRTVDPESREGQAVFRCTTCGYEENADVNAAKNVLAERGKERAGRRAVGICLWRPRGYPVYEAGTRWHPARHYHPNRPLVRLESPGFQPWGGRQSASGAAGDAQGEPDRRVFQPHVEQPLGPCSTAVH